MPQLDITTYSTQLFWIFIMLSLTYLVVDLYVLPHILRSLRLRNRILDSLTKSAKSDTTALQKELHDNVSSFLDVLHKIADYKVSLSALYDDKKVTFIDKLNVLSLKRDLAAFISASLYLGDDHENDDDDGDDVKCSMMCSTPKEFLSEEFSPLLDKIYVETLKDFSENEDDVVLSKISQTRVVGVFASLLTLSDEFILMFCFAVFVIGFFFVSNTYLTDTIDNKIKEIKDRFYEPLALKQANLMAKRDLIKSISLLGKDKRKFCRTLISDIDKYNRVSNQKLFEIKVRAHFADIQSVAKCAEIALVQNVVVGYTQNPLALKLKGHSTVDRMILVNTPLTKDFLLEEMLR